jgi:hypothetical protein
VPDDTVNNILAASLTNVGHTFNNLCQIKLLDSVF